MRRIILMVVCLGTASLACTDGGRPIDTFDNTPHSDAGPDGGSSDGGATDGGGCPLPCGETCCTASQACTASNTCVDLCTPNCDGRECGDNGCGGSCGNCDGGSCNAAGQCVCGLGSASCHGPADCCSGSCTAGTCAACQPQHQSCDGPGGCCRGTFCYQGTCSVCKSDGVSCTTFSECCSQSCNGTCQPMCGYVGQSCTTGSGCCSGLSCKDSLCCKGQAQSCSNNGECCSGTCQGGTCACRAQGNSCSSNADCCDGLSCGNGTCYQPWINKSITNGPTFRAIARPSNAQGFVVGDGGAIYRYSNGTFATVASGTTNDLMSIDYLYSSLGGTAYYYASGRGATIRTASISVGLLYGWYTGSPNTTYDLLGISAAAEKDIWAVGPQGTAVHYTDAGWGSEYVPTTQTLRSVENFGTDAWAVGDYGTILHYTPTNGWVSTPTSPGTSANLNFVRGWSTTDLYAVGDRGTIVHYNGTRWSAFNSPTQRDLTSVWYYSATDLWVTGKGGLILHYANGSWKTELDGGADLFSVRGSRVSLSDIWVVGANGTILQHP